MNQPVKRRRRKPKEKVDLKIKEITLSQGAKINLGGNSYSSVEANYALTVEVPDPENLEKIESALQKKVEEELEKIVDKQIRLWKAKVGVK